MKGTVTEKILSGHIVRGELQPGTEIALRIDQCLLQDATGTMAALQFEAIGVNRVKCELAVAYIDHNTLQIGFENMDDHLYLQSFSARYGLYFSRPGNGICHQIHFERFGVPGKTLIGSDSHTPTGGGLGMIAFGAGGLDVAMAMGGAPFYLDCPKVVGIVLTGSLQPWVSAKDIILEVLRRIGVKGGVGKVLEYFGPGVETLDAPSRATVTNMGAETGATASVFPSDARTRDFLRRQGRGSQWKQLVAEPDAQYDSVIEIDLSVLEPLVALPSSPDNVVKLSEAPDTIVRQVNIGSCTNSSYRDLMVVADALKGKTVPPEVSLIVTPGSRQVMEMLAASGALAEFIRAGARIFEPACDGCIGMGSAPATGICSVRTYNRNFPGRSGTAEDKVYLVSPETAVASALAGKLTDPRTLGNYPKVELPKIFPTGDYLIVPPPKDGSNVEIIRGPNIKPLPRRGPLKENLSGKVLIVVGDNITTDHILPGGSQVLPLRSNIPAISEYVFAALDPGFPARAKKERGGFVVGGDNYGQGSSREHAALAPMYLGVKAVIAKSFARIHKANLINFGIIPLEFVNPADYEKLKQGDMLEISDIGKKLLAGENPEIVNVGNGHRFPVRIESGARNREILAAGGLLNTLQRM